MGGPLTVDGVSLLPGARRRTRVLAIDDEPQVLRSIQRALQEPEVVIVDSGREALALLQTDQVFDVILCDLMMGEMSGMDLYGEIARLWPALAPAIVFMTGGAFTEVARDFLGRVSNACLDKPFDLYTLRTLVAERR